MAGRSGFFVHVGNSYEFLHPTFQQYLAAFHFYRSGEDHFELLRFGMCAWFSKDFAWHDCVVFLAVLLSAQPERSDLFINGLFREFVWRYRLGIASEFSTYNLLLISECLESGTEFSQKTRERIVRALELAARSSKLYVPMRVLLVRQLVALGEKDRAADFLPAFLHDSRVGEDGTTVLVELLYQCGRRRELVEVACDHRMTVRIRESAVISLAHLGDVRGLVTVLAHLGRPDNPVSDKVFAKITLLGPYAELELIATDPASSEWESATSVMLLQSFDQCPALQRIAVNDSVPIAIRKLALLGMLMKADDVMASGYWEQLHVTKKLVEPVVAVLQHFDEQLSKGSERHSEDVNLILTKLFVLVLGESTAIDRNCSGAADLINLSLSRLAQHQNGSLRPGIEV
jgi:hypothetical protein